MSNKIKLRNNWEHDYGGYSDSESETDYTDSQDGGANTIDDLLSNSIYSLNL